MDIKKILNVGFSTFCKILSPPHCIFCKEYLEEYSIFCENCDSKIKPIASYNLEVNSSCSIRVHSVSSYTQPIKSLIISKANSNIVSITKLADLIWHKSILNALEFDYLVPIPLHWTRYAKRGFNQAEIIAEVLAKYSNKEVANIVHRKKRTAFQSSLKVDQRAKNVANAFYLDSDNLEIYKNKKFVIVDDLMTTGSTLKSVAKQLLKLNPISISAIVAARVI